MGRVIFVEGMRDYREKKITFGIYLIWFLVAVMFVLFVAEPSWYVVPPFIHNFNVNI